MFRFLKTTWTKLTDGSEITKKDLTVSTDYRDLPTISNSNEHLSLEIDQIDENNEKINSSPEPHCPVFTIAIGIVDIFMLFVVYIIQGGVVPTSTTWIKMGCKYVPCMKPLYSKADQEIYNAVLKSQCESYFIPFQCFRFLTPIFLHGSVTHLLSNLIYQALAGSLLEGKYGIKTLGLCYILFGFSGNIISALYNSKSISVGASGAVYGLLFFCIIDNILRIFTITNIQDKIIQFLIILLVIPYFIMSILFDVDFSGHTDHAAHVGGAVMGILIAIFLCDMPRFITDRISNGKTRIRLFVFIIIIIYFVITLVIFYLFIPVNLK